MGPEKESLEKKGGGGAIFCGPIWWQFAQASANFARIFFRNCVANASPALACPGVRGSVEEGSRLTMDLGAGSLSNAQGRLPLEPAPYSEHLLEILRAGGLMALLKEPGTGPVGGPT